MVIKLGVSIALISAALGVRSIYLNATPEIPETERIKSAVIEGIRTPGTPETPTLAATPVPPPTPGMGAIFLSRMTKN